MPLNTRPFIIVDLETSGTAIQECLPLEIAAIAVDPISLEIYDGGEFSSVMGYPKDVLDGLNQIELADALRVNGLTVDRIIEAPDHKIVWESFISFVEHYDTTEGNSTRLKPTLTGFNICNFDIPIMLRLAGKYGNLTKDGRLNFVSSVPLDLYQMLYWWFDSTKMPERISMDYLRNWMGIPKDGAHTALADVKHTHWIMKKFLGYQRKLSQANLRKGVYENCYANSQV